MANAKGKRSGTAVATPDEDAGHSPRWRAARGTEQIVILTLAILCGLLGFPLHILWVASLVLMALLWGYLASELATSRRGGIVSSVVATVASEAHDLSQELSRAAGDAGAQSGTGSPGEPPVEEPLTKKELYEEAREAGIEGRSNMTKEELQQALDE